MRMFLMSSLLVLSFPCFAAVIETPEKIEKAFYGEIPEEWSSVKKACENWRSEKETSLENSGQSIVGSKITFSPEIIRCTVNISTIAQ
jgi:hypothetical protein